MSLCAAELRLRVGMDRPVLTRRAASADSSLTMITRGWGLERAEFLRLTGAGGALVGWCDLRTRRVLSAVRVWPVAARCGQNCGHRARRNGALHPRPGSRRPWERQDEPLLLDDYRRSCTLGLVWHRVNLAHTGVENPVTDTRLTYQKQLGRALYRR
jgi:hypothetical protein